MFGSTFNGSGGGGGDTIGIYGNNTFVPALSTYEAQYGIAGVAAGYANFAWPIGGTLLKLSVRLSSNQPASGSLVFTLLINNAASLLSVAVPANGAGTYSNTINSVNLIAGDLIRFSITNNALAPSGNIASISMFLRY